MRKTRIRRFLTTMAFAIMVLCVFALEDAQAQDVSSWAELKAALESNNTIVLKKDCIAGPEDSGLRTQTGKYITLDLNGHTIDRGLADGNAKSAGYVLRNEGNLTIRDSIGGGKITGGNNKDSGGGIYNTGWLYFEGGEISGNASEAWGGGIYMSAHQNSQVTLRGGVITGNTCKNNGGGIHVSEAAFLKASGQPRVYNNKKKANDTESDNNIKLTDKAVIEVVKPLESGAELHVFGFASNGSGPIASEYSKQNPNDNPNTFFFSDSASCTIALRDGEVMAESDYSSVDSWALLKEALYNSGIVKLAESATIRAEENDSALRVPSGMRVVLDLNGGTIDRGLSDSGPKTDGFVIRNDGTLTIIDKSDEKTGTITGGYTNAVGSSGTAGGIFNNGTLTFEGGRLTGNRSTGSGGGIYNSGTVNLIGGTIDNNVSSSRGGGIFNNGKVSISGGTMTGNTAENGGGIYNNGNCSVILESSIMSENSARSSADAIYNSGELTVTGSTIEGNQREGVYMDNGSFTLDASSIISGGGIHLRGGNLMMKNGSSVTGSIGYGIYADGGNTTMENGTIDSMMGVYLSGSDFIMQDGTISASNIGVSVMDYGFFTMNDGTVSVGKQYDTDSKYGVYMNNAGSFTIDNGEIRLGGGGELSIGVYAAKKSAFTMYGGSITGEWYNGVFLRESTFSMNGQPITGAIQLAGRNDVIQIYGDLGEKHYQIRKETPGVFTSGLKMNGSLQNFSYDYGMYQMVLNGDGEAELINAWPVLQEQINEAQNGSTITLTQDHFGTYENTGLVVPAGKEITIDLAGHVIDRGLLRVHIPRDDGYVIKNEGTLTIMDSVGGGKITGGYMNGSGFHMNLAPDSISNTELDFITGGSGICNYGVLYLEGGSITGNCAGSQVRGYTNMASGGGIFNAGRMTMSGGSVIGNTANGNGAGIYNSGKMTMTGGEVSGNTAIYRPGTERYTLISFGGGIYLSEDAVATLYLQGGTIKENTCVNGGGGIYVSDGATLRVSGDPVVTGNTRKGKASNIALAGSSLIELISRVENADLGVTSAQASGCVTKYYSDHNRDIPPEECFHADRDGSGILLKNDEVHVETSTSNVPYVKRSWNGSSVVDDPATAETAFLVPSDGNMARGWYYLDRDLNLNKRICLEGDTNLILGDGCTLTVKGLYVPAGSVLSIYGQTEGTGALVSKPSEGAAIGAYPGHNSGNIFIYGGSIQATGANHCAGIGGNDADEGMVPDVTIYGGTVTATGGGSGAGIGGGRDCDGGKIEIYGGNVTATGKDSSAGIGSGDPRDKTAYSSIINIYGGTVTATGNAKAAGIGGGEYGFARIRISGGTVRATGGSSGGAGIGTGADGKSATVCYPTTVEISGGVITAVTKNSDAKGVGNGKNTDNCTVTLNYTAENKDTVRITSPSYGGTVMLKRPFMKQGSGSILPAGSLSGNDILKDSTLTATDVVLSGWDLLQFKLDSAENGSVVTLEDDYTAGEGASPLLISSGKSITIDLNGKTLDRGLGGAPDTAKENGSVIEVAEGGSLTITDSKDSGIIKGGYAVKGGGIYCRGNLILRGGTIQNNSCSGSGGGIYCSGHMIMEGGTICGNSSEHWGGGIYLPDDTGATLTLTGGMIKENTCGRNGGGVHVSETAAMQISGCPMVFGNKLNSMSEETDNNVNLAGNTVMKVTGPLTHGVDTERIHVSRSNDIGVLTDGLKGKGSDSSFAPDDSDYAVAVNADGEAELEEKDRTVLILFLPGDELADGPDPVPGNPMSVQRNASYTLPACSYTVENKVFQEWSIRIGSAEPVSKNEGDTIAVTEDTVITAVWEAHTHNFTYTAEGSTITAVCDNADGLCDLQEPYKAALTIAAPEIPLTYDGTEKVAILSGGIPGTAEPEIHYTKNGESFSEVPKDAGTYTAYITLTGVKIGEGTTDDVTASVSYTILPKTVLILGATAAEREYDEAGSRTVKISAVTLDTAELKPDIDYTAVGEMEDGNAGDEKIVTVTVTLLNNNFVLPENETSIPTTVRIRRINYSGPKTAVGEANPGTANATVKLPVLPSGARYDGAHLAVDGKTGGLISGTPTVTQEEDGFVLKYSTSEQATGGSTTISIPVTGATNYEDYNVTVSVTVRGKEDAEVKLTDVVRNATWGDRDFPLTATVTNPGTEGIWRWSVSETDVAGITSGNGEEENGTATVKIRNAGITTITVLYNSDTTTGSAEITLTVKPKSVVIPAAASDLIWTGEEQVGVEAGDECCVVGGNETEAGTYTAIATLVNPTNCRWNDGTMEPKYISWTIAKADGPDAPKDLVGTAPTTAENKDGKITGVTEGMEYGIAGSDSWNSVDGEEISGLTPNTYSVRFAETETHEAGEATEVTVPAYTEPTPPETMTAFVTDYSDFYDGQPHGIDVVVTVPATGFKIRYGETEGSCNLDQSPMFTNAGTYTVYYEITAEGYSSIIGSATVEINPAIPDIIAPKPVEKLTYTGEALELITPGLINCGISGTLYYAATLENTVPTEDRFTTEIPTGTDAGVYYVWYKAKVNAEAAISGDYQNYQDSNVTMITSIVYPVEYIQPTFLLPGQLIRIEANAFEKASFTTVDASSCTSIGAGAFRDCVNLKQIQLSEDCEIDPSAFDGCDMVYVFAPKGKATEASCKEIPNCLFAGPAE